MTMSGCFTALASGFLFGVGHAVSHMVDPAKVLGFLDIAGNWDPSLIFVMGGAFLVTIVVLPQVLRRERPLNAASFSAPAVSSVDRLLVAGFAFSNAIPSRRGAQHQRVRRCRPTAKGCRGSDPSTGV